MNKVKIVSSDDEYGLKDMAMDLAETPRGLSLYFLGIGSIIEKNDKRFDPKAWYKQSGTNVCYISYKYKKFGTNLLTLPVHMHNMLKSRRLEYVASKSRYFVELIRAGCNIIRGEKCLNHLRQVTAVGFSFGAHVAAYFCRYAKDYWRGERVAFALGLDPAAISFWLNKHDYLKKGDADYVQIVHSVNMPLGKFGWIGTSKKSGDTDIIVTSNCYFWQLYGNHKLAPYIHELTSQRKAVMIAVKKGKGYITYTKVDENVPVPTDLGHPSLSYASDANLKPYQCMVGIYNRNHCKEGKVFYIHLSNVTCALFSPWKMDRA